MNDIKKVLQKQLNNNFFLEKKELKTIDSAIFEAVDLCHRCLSNNKNKYINHYDVKVTPYNTVQYMIFMYYLSNIIHEKYKDDKLATKVYYLNKIINSVELFYAIKLPEIFWAEHPIGAVMGRAVYSNFFCFYQNTTVGGNKGKYPIFGERVIMYANSVVIGNSKIGNNVILSANSYIKDEVIPDNSVVYGSTPKLLIKNRKDIVDENINRIFSI